MKPCARFLGVIALTWAAASPAYAGMPSISLSEVTMLRLSTISFFLVCLLGASWVIMRIWNGLTTDFPRLPKISYKRAVGLVTLWSFLFLLILTMISGARELMTPGAWKKEGYVYVLNDEHKTPKPDDFMVKLEIRRESLRRLKSALWEYAQKHNGDLPPKRDVPEIPSVLWQVPDISAMPYLYLPGKTTPDSPDPVPVAYEPGIFGATRLVLFSDGKIREFSSNELENMLSREGK